MRKVSFSMVCIALWGMVAAAQAGDQVTIELSMTIAPSCKVTEQVRTELQDRPTINVRTACNTEYFRFMLSSPSDQLQVVAAQSTNAVTDVQPGMNEVAVRLYRPGQQDFSFQLEEALPPTEPVSIEIIYF